MAAMDTVQEFLASLSEHDRATLDRYIRAQCADLFAARSEDARMRIAMNFIQEVHDQLHQGKRF